ncbi:MAG TPA: sigma-54-dependent Fis family transcriptional regulator [Planctomycetaceae bacterium]|nr:sigma-54-dependent Fis family transcriptional regulator [Planctomycetaceae bacterium]
MDATRTLGSPASSEARPAPRVRWMKWAEVPWLARSEAGGSAVQLCERLLQSSLELIGVKSFLHERLPDVATEIAAQWTAVVERTPEWTTRGACGHHPLSQLPHRFMEEALDREAGGWLPLDEPAGWSFIAVSLPARQRPGTLLVLAGRNLAADALPMALTVGRTLGLCLQITEARERHARRESRLRSTLEITSSFARERKSGRLLEVIAVEATRLLDCDRASIFIWDKEHNEVVACPALGVEGGTLRLPHDAGIVGEVILTGKTVRVDDAYQDPRFNPDVDKQSGYRTRNLLCVPMHSPDGELIGAFEGINKNEGGFDPEDEVSLKQLGIHAATAMRNTREWEQLIRSREQLTEQVTKGVRLIGQSPAIVALRATIGRLAATDLPVLILGESGTGKEVVAQALHFQGTRSNSPFVAVNCAALTETLLESELFGHEKGAFTDAHEARQGKFELADGGTLFLDEIGDMSPGGQAKLLRVLEQKIITRVGGSKPIPIDVRVVAATNANLPELVRARKFREDLYYRLSVVTQTLPPLRERPEDILLLAEYFLKQFCQQANRAALQLTPEARRRLQAHAWPGNVRELRNLMERIAFLNPTDRVEADDLAFILSPDRDSPLEPAPDVGLKEATRQFQQEYIRRSIRRVSGNMSQAAELLGLHRSNLYRKMRQLRMKEADSLEPE